MIEFENDLFERRGIAKRIAKGLIENGKESESLVFGLNGQWGSGKSTMLNYIREYIEENYENNGEKYIIFDFNPWVFSGQIGVQYFFLSELSKKLRGLGDKVVFGLRKISKYLSRTELLKVTDTVLPIKLASPIQKIFKELSDETLEDLKKNVNKLIKDKNYAIYIFIDDFDRLLPNEIIEVLQMIKLNTNFPNTRYVIAFDREVVINSLKDRFKERGSYYLEKIVNIDYTIPNAPNDVLFTVISTTIEKFLKNNNIEYDTKSFSSLWNCGFKEYFQTLRDLQRYLDAILFRLPQVKDNSDSSDFSITHFLVIEAIRVFDHNNYERFNKLVVNSLSQNVSFANFLNLLDNENFENSIIKRVMKYLFNREKIIDGIKLSPESQNIYNHKYIERYFSLNSDSDKNISEEELRIYLEKKTLREEHLNVIFENGRLVDLLRLLRSDQLKSTIDRYSIRVDIGMISEIIAFMDKNSLYNETHEIYIKRLWQVSQNIMGCFESPKAGIFQLVNLILTNSENSPTGLILLYYLSQNQILDAQLNEEKIEQFMFGEAKTYLDENVLYQFYHVDFFRTLLEILSNKKYYNHFSYFKEKLEADFIFKKKIIELSQRDIKIKQIIDEYNVDELKSSPPITV